MRLVRRGHYWEPECGGEMLISSYTFAVSMTAFVRMSSSGGRLKYKSMGALIVRENAVEVGLDKLTDTCLGIEEKAE